MFNRTSRTLNSIRRGWKRPQKLLFLAKSVAIVLLAIYCVWKIFLLGSSSSDEKQQYGPTSRLERLHQLKNWAVSNGARINEKVEIKRDKGDAGSGFFALQALKTHEEVCAVPDELVILPEEDGSPVFNLVRYLMASHNDAAYVASLPWEDVDTVHLTPDYELAINQAIEGSDEEIVDVTTFKRAFMLVISRVHRVGEHPFALVPLCDMFNTPSITTSSNSRSNVANVECTWIKNQSNKLKGGFEYSCQTTTPIQAGDALLVAYRDQNGQLVDNHILSKQWGIIS